MIKLDILGDRMRRLSRAIRVFITRSKGLGLWLAEPWTVWLATGVIAIASVIVLLSGSSEPRIRITGLILQLLGIGTVVWGIRETRKEFGFPPDQRQSHGSSHTVWAVAATPRHPQLPGEDWRDEHNLAIRPAVSPGLPSHLAIQSGLATAHLD